MKKARIEQVGIEGNACWAVFPHHHYIKGIIMDWVGAWRSNTQPEILKRSPMSKEEKTRVVKERFVDPASGQRTNSQCPIREEIFSGEAHSCACASFVFLRSRIMWLLFIPKNEKCIEWNAFSVSWASKNKNGRVVEEADNSIALNSGRHVQRCIDRRGEYVQGDKS